MPTRTCLLALLAVAAASAQEVPADAYAAIGSDLVVLKQDVIEFSQLTQRPAEVALIELVSTRVIRHGLTQRGVDIGQVDAGELEEVRREYREDEGFPAAALEKLDLPALVAFGAFARAQVQPEAARELYTDYGWSMFGRTRARVIQLSTNSVRTAEQATAELAKIAAELGEDVDDATFAARAAKESDSPFAAFDGGDTEWFGAAGVSSLGRGSNVPRAVVEACFRRRKPGLIAKPVRDRRGVYLVRITDVKLQPSFDELTPRERTMLLDVVAKKQQYGVLMRTMHKEAHVRYSTDAPGRR